jgi:predicted HAD superfamily phosphohydrolase
MFVNLALTRIDRQVDVAERRLENGLKTFEEMSDYGDRMKYTIKRHVEESSYYKALNKSVCDS